VLIVATQILDLRPAEEHHVSLGSQYQAPGGQFQPRHATSVYDFQVSFALLSLEALNEPIPSYVHFFFKALNSLYL
jgi:hypothetical protein